MENELIGIFRRTLDAHFPEGVGVTREAYVTTFETTLHGEIPEAPVLDVATGVPATYIKLSVLGLAMARQLETYGLSEEQVGERIYRTADAYFRLSPVRRWIQRSLFFSRVNIRQIKARQEATSRSENGINGFQAAICRRHPAGRVRCRLPLVRDLHILRAEGHVRVREVPLPG